MNVHADLVPVRAARAASGRRMRRVVVALSSAVVAMFAIDVLLGSYTVTIADFVRIMSGEVIPGAAWTPYAATSTTTAPHTWPPPAPPPRPTNQYPPPSPDD